MASPREGMAYVVVGKNTEANQLVVGWDEMSGHQLYATKCIVGSVSSTNDPIRGGRLDAQPRYRAKSEPVKVTELEDGKFEVEFSRPQRALTPGQICAFYEGGKMLGGGVFEKVLGEEG